MQLINFLIMMTVIVMVALASVYCFVCLRKDYRRWLYLGVGISFAIIGVGCVMSKSGFDVTGSIILMSGIVSGMSISGLAVVIRAGDKWMQSKEFYIKSWQKNQPLEKTCKKHQSSSIPHHLYHN